mmetsp:Transcript_85503/g.238647  ORF Transcript_85503/g.238647 Transcript_85503/m.238647 type:complete len:322 (+) Transcript_85503:109-1074(+)
MYGEGGGVVGASSSTPGTGEDGQTQNSGTEGAGGEIATADAVAAAACGTFVPQGILPQGMLPQGTLPQDALSQAIMPPGMLPQGVMPAQLPTGQFPQACTAGYGVDGFGAFGAFPAFGAYGGFGATAGVGMYPGMSPMYGAYGMSSMYPQVGYFPQAGMPSAGGAFQPQALAGQMPDDQDRENKPIPTAAGPNGQNLMPGDWLCPRCADHVFARNLACRRCATPKPEGAALGSEALAAMGAGVAGGLPPRAGGANNQRAMPGDWNCPKCRDLQFARNKQCRMCGTPKPEAGGFDLSAGPIPALRSPSRARRTSRSRSPRPT